MFKKILALHTGGTISMAADDSGAVITNEVNPMTQVTSPIEGIEVTSEDYLQSTKPSNDTASHVSPISKNQRGSSATTMASSLPTGQIRWKKRLISWIPWSYQRSLWSLQELCEAPTNLEATASIIF